MARRLLLLFLILAATATPALAQTAPTSAKTDYEVLDAKLESLRARFNEDCNHPRVLMLLSPT